jgi:hypothetical protein
VRDRSDDDEEAEQLSSRPRSRSAPSVVFRTEPDIWLRTLVGAAVALLSFISYSSWTGNREMGELRTEVRVYRESTDRRLAWLESMVQRILLEP